MMNTTDENPTPRSLTRIAIGGATGFVGSALGKALGRDFYVLGLGRNVPEKAEGFSEWKKTDFLSLLDAEKALEGVEIAYYLIHSMMPSAHLAQGAFQDFDLIAADNFARSAKKNGVRQIVYLGGIIPEGEELSPHLKSRREVEDVLAGYGTPVTTLRASIIVGGKGSSFVMIRRLAERLPVMLCPSWTRTQTQPIALDDVVALLRYCAGNQDVYSDTFDIGGPDVLTYEQMMLETGRAMGKEIRVFHSPFLTPGLSRLWITVITGAPRSLVLPLIQSLRHRMVARDRRLQIAAGIPGSGFSEVVRRVILENTDSAHSPKPVAFLGNRRGKPEMDVSSVQRFHFPSWVTATWVAREYMRWLPTLFGFILRVQVDSEEVCKFYLWPLRKPLLVLNYSRSRSTQDRALFYVSGGSLAKIKGRGRFEIREVLNRRFILMSVLEFRPSLPWFLYKFSQARVHLWVMRAFGRHLQKTSRESKAKTEKF